MGIPVSGNTDKSTSGGEGCPPHTSHGWRKANSRQLTTFSEVHSHASGDHVALPVVEIAGIAAILDELEVTVFVGALEIPPAEAVAHASTNRVAIVEVGMGQRDQRGLRRTVAGSEFGLALYMYEDALVGTEVVFEHNWNLQQFQIVTNHDLVVDGGNGEIDLAHLGVDGEREIAGGLESEPTEDGELLGMIGGVGRKADFAAGYDAGASDLGGGLLHNNVAVNVNYSAVDNR